VDIGKLFFSHNGTAACTVRVPNALMWPKCESVANRAWKIIGAPTVQSALIQPEANSSPANLLPESVNHGSELYFQFISTIFDFSFLGRSIFLFNAAFQI
jgi:hypothetical protein